MIKARKRWISVILTLTMLATLLLPMATPSFAAGTVTVIGKATVSADADADLGALKFEIPAGDATKGIIYVKLPETVSFAAYTDAGPNLGTFGNTAPGATVLGAGGSLPYVYTPALVGTTPNAADTNIASVMLTDERTVRIVFGQQDPVTGLGAGVTTFPANNPAWVYVYLRNVNVPSGFSGDLDATINSDSGAFNLGTATVATAGSGKVGVTMDTVPSFSDTANLIFYVGELSKNSLVGSEKTVKIKLPSGFEWNSANTTGTLWGQAGLHTNMREVISSDGRTLTLDTTTNGALAADLYPSAKSALKIQAQIQVSDYTLAKLGDVTATVSGDSKIATTSVVMAKYGDFGVNISSEAKDVYAGKIDQKIGDIVIEENSPGSLIGTTASPRSIMLTLPANAKWIKLPEVDDSQVSATYVGLVGTDGRTARYNLTTQSTTKAGKITLEKGEIALASDVTGDVKVEFTGTAGVKGEVIAAKVVAPLTVTGSKPNVIIGEQGQVAGDIEVTEVAAEVITGGSKEIKLSLPKGVSFATTPKVEVTEGDLIIDTNNVRVSGDNDEFVLIPVKSESAVASKFKVSGIKYTVDRTYPVGDIKISIGGLALVEVNDQDTVNGGTAVVANNFVVTPEQPSGNDTYDANDDGLFPGANSVVSFVNAVCMTPSPKDNANKAKFVIGDTKFTVNDEEFTMDVAPYVKDGRTFLPVRYVAQALGVSDANILWDGKTNKVTLIKGGTVVQLTIGSNIMLVNGTAVTMDVPAEITSGRTMLPFRFIAQALGATVGWDDATQTVTMEL